MAIALGADYLPVLQALATALTDARWSAVPSVNGVDVPRKVRDSSPASRVGKVVTPE